MSTPRADASSDRLHTKARDDERHLTLLNAVGPVCTAAETCEEMLADLTREIASVKSGESVKGYPVETVAFVARNSPYFIYRIRVGRRLPLLRTESPLMLQLDVTRSLPGQVISAGKRTLTIATTQTLPEAIPEHALVVFDDSWLLERQRTKLNHVYQRIVNDSVGKEYNIELAQMVLGDGSFEGNRLPSIASVAPEILDPLNEDQQAAVHAGMNQRVTYLWGPPGTGKTTTLSALIHAQVLAGRRVLVLAPSNASADVLALALATRLSNIERFERGLMLRVGPRPSTELRRRFGNRIVPQDIAERLVSEACASLERSIAEEIADCEFALARRPEPALSRRLTLQLSACREQLKSVLNELDKMEKRKLEQLLEDCTVLVTPIHNVYLSSQLRGRFDLIVVDEASMVTLPQLFLSVALFARSSEAARPSQVVVGGDFRQLSAPVGHPDPRSVPSLSTDVFEKLGIPGDVAREDDPPYLSMLTLQYRMSGPICRLVSDLYYAGRLRCAPGVARRVAPGWALGLGPLLLVDTTASAPRVVIPRGTSSRENLVHAEVASRLVESLTAKEAGSDAGRLLVLSPFASQVELLRDTMAPLRRVSGSQVGVSSVHRAQGAEADTVVLSLDDAPGARVSRFMSGRDWSSDTSRLLNVAVSRGRGRVVVIAAVSHLMKEGGPAARRFLEALQEHGQVVSADEFIAQRPF